MKIIELTKDVIILEAAATGVTVSANLQCALYVS